jgi:diguanylate cyclase
VGTVDRSAGALTFRGALWSRARTWLYSGAGRSVVPELPAPHERFRRKKKNVFGARIRPHVKLKRMATSLVTRLVVMGLAMAAVGTAASYFQLTRFLREDLTKSVSAQQTALAEYVARDIDSYLDERLQFLGRLAASLPPEFLSQPVPLEAWLARRAALSPVFPMGLAVFDRFGHRLDGSGPFAVDTAAFTGALGGQPTLGQPSKMADSSNAALPMGAPIRNPAGEVVAVLLGTADLAAEGLLGHPDDGRVGHAGGLLLVSPRDRLFVASTEAAMSMQPTPAPGVNLLHDRAMTGFRGSGITRNAKGIEEISAIASVPLSGWFVVARLPVAEALAPVARMQRFILMQRGPAVLAVLVLIGLVMTWLLRPLLRAARHAEKMARGEMALAPLQVVRDDEIGHLTRAFNSLLAKLGEQQAALERLAHYDILTGLPNRKLLDDRLRQMLACTGQGGGPVAVLYLDLDGFKQLNDTFGHDAGDEALRRIAQRLLGLVKPTDTVARIGGDEFVLLLAGFDAPAERTVQWLAQRCIDAIGQPLHLDPTDIAIGVSIGIVLTEGDDAPEALLAAADKAMYQAKQGGRSGYVLAPRDDDRPVPESARTQSSCESCVAAVPARQ